MEDLEFFDITFIGRPISFPSLNSVWTLTENLRERHAQMTPDEVLEDEWAVPSVSYGTFRAKNTADLTQEAFVRIILQVYHAGGEIMSSEERARQAKQTLPRYGQDMLDALTLLEEAQCSSAPRLLGVARKVQSSTDPVPGGFYTCLLLESLPGQKIGPWFWQLDLQKRDFIRAQFKAAWLECTTIGQYRPISAPSKILWDETTQRISFYDFLTGYKSDEPIPWKDVCYVLFGLARVPPGFRLWKDISDTKDWEF